MHLGLNSLFTGYYILPLTSQFWDLWGVLCKGLDYGCGCGSVCDHGHNVVMAKGKASVRKCHKAMDIFCNLGWLFSENEYRRLAKKRLDYHMLGNLSFAGKIHQSSWASYGRLPFRAPLGNLHSQIPSSIQSTLQCSPVPQGALVPNIDLNPRSRPSFPTAHYRGRCTL